MQPNKKQRCPNETSKVTGEYHEYGTEEEEEEEEGGREGGGE